MSERGKGRRDIYGVAVMSGRCHIFIEGLASVEQGDLAHVFKHAALDPVTTIILLQSVADGAMFHLCFVGFSSPLRNRNKRQTNINVFTVFLLSVVTVGVDSRRRGDKSSKIWGGVDTNIYVSKVSACCVHFCKR